MILLSSEGRTSKSWTKLTFVQGTKLFWDEGERKMGSDPQRGYRAKWIQQHENQSAL